MEDVSILTKPVFDLRAVLHREGAGASPWVLVQCGEVRAPPCWGKGSVWISQRRETGSEHWGAGKGGGANVERKKISDDFSEISDDFSEIS